jgi:hypothetical protein
MKFICQAQKHLGDTNIVKYEGERNRKTIFGIDRENDSGIIRSQELYALKRIVSSPILEGLQTSEIKTPFAHPSSTELNK